MESILEMPRNSIFQGPSSLHLDRWYWRRLEVQDQDPWGVSQLCCWPANLELWWVLLLPGLISLQLIFASASTWHFPGWRIQLWYLPSPCQILPRPLQVSSDSEILIAINGTISRGGKNIMVMCETYKYNKEKTETNKRKECAEVMEKAKHHHPWFGE